MAYYVVYNKFMKQGEIYLLYYFTHLRVIFWKKNIEKG